MCVGFQGAQYSATRNVLGQRPGNGVLLNPRPLTHLQTFAAQCERAQRKASEYAASEGELLGKPLLSLMDRQTKNVIPLLLTMCKATSLLFRNDPPSGTPAAFPWSTTDGYVSKQKPLSVTSGRTTYRCVLCKLIEGRPHARVAHGGALDVGSWELTILSDGCRKRRRNFVRRSAQVPKSLPVNRDHEGRRMPSDARADRATSYWNLGVHIIS